jgi:hypothetical protein
MTTSSIGTVSHRIPQVHGYTISTSVVNPSVTIIEVVTPPSPAPTPPVYVIVDGVATSLDNPGMARFPVRANLIPLQTDAVRSAAQNTALAFGLNTVTAGDNAVRFSNKSFQNTINDLQIISQTTTTSVVIPA